MSYDLEAINTLFAQIAECMHRNPARAMRLLGQAKAKVQTTLARATNGHDVRLAAEGPDHEPDYPPEIWRDDDRQQRGGDVERIRNAGAILDCLTSNLSSDHPLRLEAAGGARQAVADLYRIADGLDTVISAQQRQGEGGE